MSAPPPYSLVERLLHRVAFATAAVQLGAADVERALHHSRFERVLIERPIFVTSLPRAGTTLVLERLAAHAHAASHTYRDMPFVLAPLLWAQLSGSFRVAQLQTERAHGDGMQVSVDSPEAFEEVAWRAFWPEKYEADRIRLWAATDDADGFASFMQSLMQRVIAARSTASALKQRYVSKNNANVSRLGLLTRLWPDAQIVVPFREPVAQAVSLLTQHRRFVAMHREHAFAARYMADIGHFEFGALHRPFAFEGVDDLCTRYRSETLDYWLAYWTRGFQHVLRHAEALRFVSYERLCANGHAALATVLSSVGLPEHTYDASSALWEPRVYQDHRGEVQDPTLLDEADAVHALLLRRSIV